MLLCNLWLIFLGIGTFINHLDARREVAFDAYVPSIRVSRTQKEQVKRMSGITTILDAFLVKGFNIVCLN